MKCVLIIFVLYKKGDGEGKSFLLITLEKK